MFFEAAILAASVAVSALIVALSAAYKYGYSPGEYDQHYQKQGVDLFHIFVPKSQSPKGSQTFQFPSFKSAW